MLDSEQAGLGRLMMKLQLWTKRAAHSEGVNREKALKYQKSYQDRVRAFLNEPSDSAEVEPANCFLCILMEQQDTFLLDRQGMESPSLEAVVEGVKLMGADFPLVEEQVSLPPLCLRCSDLMNKVIVASAIVAENP